MGAAAWVSSEVGQGCLLKPQTAVLAGDGAAGLGGSGWAPPAPVTPSFPPPHLTPSGSSTVDLLIYQTLCYTRDELRDVDVGDFVLKPCGLEEFLQK